MQGVLQGRFVTSIRMIELETKREPSSSGKVCLKSRLGKLHLLCRGQVPRRRGQHGLQKLRHAHICERTRIYCGLGLSSVCLLN